MHAPPEWYSLMLRAWKTQAKELIQYRGSK
jgi:hypothetical protein